VSLGAGLLYTAVVVPLGLIHEQSYCPGHSDCSDLSGFAAALGGIGLLAGCSAATVGGIFGDDRPKLPALEQLRLFVGRGRRRRRPTADVR
jgi:hypothetical protein